MPTQTVQLPLQGTMAGFRRFTVDEYHRLIEIGLLTEDDNLELLEGYLVNKLTKNPPHECAIGLTGELLNLHKPAGWIVRIQEAITLSDSEPEPAIVLARGTPRSYAARHPGPGDIGLVVEVADLTLPGDRADKARIYARAGLPVYWIGNLVDRQVEVYTLPSGPTPSPAYAQRQDYRGGDSVPFTLDGTAVATILVDELLP
jgi:Uma2 family endonuclease